VRAVAAYKGRHVACLLDTKGPEIRTAKLKGGNPLELQVGACIVCWGVGGGGPFNRGSRLIEAWRAARPAYYPLGFS
jgi:hypothetical protein